MKQHYQIHSQFGYGNIVIIALTAHMSHDPLLTGCSGPLKSLTIANVSKHLGIYTSNSCIVSRPGVVFLTPMSNIHLLFYLRFRQIILVTTRTPYHTTHNNLIHCLYRNIDWCDKNLLGDSMVSINKEEYLYSSLWLSDDTR